MYIATMIRTYTHAALAPLPGVSGNLSRFPRAEPVALCARDSLYIELPMGGKPALMQHLRCCALNAVGGGRAGSPPNFSERWVHPARASRALTLGVKADPPLRTASENLEPDLRSGVQGGWGGIRNATALLMGNAAMAWACQARATEAIPAEPWKNETTAWGVYATEMADTIGPWVAVTALALGGLALWRMLRPQGGNTYGPQFPVSRHSAPTEAADVSLRPQLSSDPVIPGYNIERKLGEGGLGEVYLATKTRGKIFFAIKVLGASGVTKGWGDIEARWKREVEAMRGIEHRNVVKVFDSGVTAARQPYFVMQYMKGGSLADWMETHKKPDGDLSIREFERQCARKLIAILDGLQAIHDAGWVHRDIKPDNILMTKTHRPKLADFGLARSTVINNQLTKTNVVVGTPLYMSPERFERVAPDQFCDTYALGTILYEMLTGHFPYPYDKGSTAAKIISAVLKHSPKDPRQYDDRISEPLAKIVLKAVAKKPEDRFQTAETFRSFLLDFVKGGDPFSNLTAPHAAPGPTAAILPPTVIQQPQPAEGAAALDGTHVTDRGAPAPEPTDVRPRPAVSIANGEGERSMGEREMSYLQGGGGDWQRRGPRRPTEIDDLPTDASDDPAPRDVGRRQRGYMSGEGGRGDDTEDQT